MAMNVEDTNVVKLNIDDTQYKKENVKLTPTQYGEIKYWKHTIQKGEC